MPDPDVSHRRQSGEAVGHDPDSTEPQPMLNLEQQIALLEDAGLPVPVWLRNQAAAAARER